MLCFRVISDDIDPNNKGEYTPCGTRPVMMKMMRCIGRRFGIMFGFGKG